MTGCVRSASERWVRARRTVRAMVAAPHTRRYRDERRQHVAATEAPGRRVYESAQMKFTALAGRLGITRQRAAVLLARSPTMPRSRP